MYLLKGRGCPLRRYKEQTGVYQTGIRCAGPQGEALCGEARPGTARPLSSAGITRYLKALTASDGCPG